MSSQVTQGQATRDNEDKSASGYLILQALSSGSTGSREEITHGDCVKLLMVEGSIKPVLQAIVKMNDGSTTAWTNLLNLLLHFLKSTEVWSEEENGKFERKKTIGDIIAIDKATILCLLNEASIIDDSNSKLYLAKFPRLIETLMKFWFNDKYYKYTEFSWPILVNLTKDASVAAYLSTEYPDLINQVLFRFQWMKYDDKIELNQHIFNFGSMILCNFSQADSARRFLLDKEKSATAHFGVYLDIKSDVCRQHIAGTLKNCLFDIDSHLWLINDVDILSTLLKPLAGGEDFTDEETDKLPIDVQYLPQDKQRDSDPVVRKYLLEGLLKLCQKRETRDALREKNVYLILREYHKWEKDEDLLELLELVVNILIRTEDEIGVEDYSNVTLDECAHSIDALTLRTTETTSETPDA